MTRNAIVDALGVLKAGRIVDLTHLVHPGIQRFGPFPAMRTEPRYTVAESGFHVEQVSFVTHYGTHVDAPEHFVEDRCTLERIELEKLMLPLFVLHFEDKVAADPEFINSSCMSTTSSAGRPSTARFPQIASSPSRAAGTTGWKAAT